MIALSDNQRDCLKLLVHSAVVFGVMCYADSRLSLFGLAGYYVPGIEWWELYWRLARHNLILLGGTECASCVCLLAAFAAGKARQPLETALRSNAGVFVTFSASITAGILCTGTDQIAWLSVAALYWLHAEIMRFGVWKFGEKPADWWP